MNVYFGIDIGGTRVKTAVVTAAGEILARTELPTLTEAGFADLVERINGALDDSLTAARLTRADVRGVGAGIAGFLDVDTGTVIEAVNIGWSNLPFVDLLERVMKLPVTIENDANVAALGEAWIGAGQGARSVLCATVGTGIGGGIVIEDRLYRGVSGMAGEIGHMVLHREGPLCNCGHHGCLEVLASATAIVREAKVRRSTGELPADADILGAADVFQLAAEGHAAAQEVIQTAGEWLGYGLAVAATCLNPDVIVVGGGVSKAGESLMTPIRSAFARYALPLVGKPEDVRLAQLGNDAGVIGAARVAALKWPH